MKKLFDRIGLLASSAYCAEIELRMIEDEVKLLAADKNRLEEENIKLQEKINKLVDEQKET